MIQLLFLLLGGRALRPTWRLLTLAGAIWMILGMLILWDLSDGVLSVVLDTLAFIFIVEGLVEIGAVALSRPKGHWTDALRGLAFLVAAVLVFTLPGDNDIGSALVFGGAFLLDGLLRVASAFVIHGSRWRTGTLAGMIEIALSAAILFSWPISYALAVPFCMALLSLTSGFAVLHMAWQLRLLPPGGSVTALPLYSVGNWHALRLSVGRTNPVVVQEDAVLHVHVWTARGSIEHARRRPLVDRYVAAVDRDGIVSTGHSALEMPPDLYISHYPASDIDHHPDDFRALLSARPENDVAGRFLPSLAEEAAAWRMPDHRISFDIVNVLSLRAFWADYARDSSYNLTARNCSTTVILALDVALEGWACSGRPWRDMLGLLVDPYFWMLRIVRGRAEAMTWTPGLVLDYVRILRRLRPPQRDWWWTRVGQAMAMRRTQARRHRAAGREPRRYD